MSPEAVLPCSKSLGVYYLKTVLSSFFMKNSYKPFLDKELKKTKLE